MDDEDERKGREILENLRIANLPWRISRDGTSICDLDDVIILCSTDECKPSLLQLVVDVINGLAEVVIRETFTND